MAKLEIEQAPAVVLPRRFLLTAPLWGMLAGGLLIFDGDAAVLSRWSPGTLALVHAFTLGVLGNAMFGSVLQFLPAAGGVRVYGGLRWGIGLHALLNLGAACLLPGLRWWSPGLLQAGGTLLMGAFLLLAAMTLPGVFMAHGRRLLRAGLGVALLAAVVVAAMGGSLVLGVTGHLTLPLTRLTDVHAAWGVGWMLVLIASVARVVMPMFQGTANVPGTAQGSWLGAVLLVLVAGSVLWLAGTHAGLLRVGVALLGLAFGAAGLWLQVRASRLRKGALVRFWSGGLLALVLAASALLAGTRDGLLAGALALGIGMPLLVIGMLLEIVAFLGWIDLHRRCGRGMRLPSVQQLLPESEKLRVLIAQLAMSAALVGAVLWPNPWLARVAGALMLLAYGVLWMALSSVKRPVRDFTFSREK